MKKLLLFAMLALTVQPCLSQIIANDRKIDWSKAGVKGGVPNRTKICSNVTAANTLAQINSAIAACPAHQVVQFAAGTYTLAGGIVINGKSNITIRGAGPLLTILNFSSSNSCNGLGASICVRAATLNDLDSPGNTTNWTAGYAKGTTVITLQSVTNLSVGGLLMLDRINDSTTDNNAIWICRVANTCCLDCATPSRNSGGLRSQVQITRVTAINGLNVTIEPGIIWPNFASGTTDPEAWYASGAAIKGVGIEGFTINTESATGGSSVMFANATDSWMRNNRILHLTEKGVWKYQTVGIDISFNYFFDKQGSDASQEGSESYGTNDYLASMSLTYQNIFHHITSPIQCESGTGSVDAYNYSFDDFYNLSSPEWAQASSYTHGTCAYLLHEGNIGFGMIQDIVHAQNFFHTAFRNRWDGFETGKSLQTVPIHIYAANRYSNIIGNVLGNNTYHTQYESFPGTPGGSCDQAIYAIGFGGNCGNGSIANKANTRTSLLRWGNYDTVNDASRFLAAEVPTTDPNYPNSTPPNNNLPASLWTTKKPFRYGNSNPWPGIGPDIAGGDLTSVNGHAFSNPAKLCWDNTSKTSGVLDFDANTCYGAVTPPGNVN